MTGAVVVLALYACRPTVPEALQHHTMNWQQRTPRQLQMLPLVLLPSMPLLC
jgi:hypothetical protein